MTAKEFADVAQALAWPVLTLIIVVLFYSPLVVLLERLASTLKVKAVKVRAFGAEIELTPEEVKAAISDLLQEISDPTNELAGDEILLFEQIVIADGRKTVAELLPSFQRGNEDHQRLQRLRDQHLVRPFEGSRWLLEKHPVVTRFGRLVYELKSRRGAAPDG